MAGQGIQFLPLGRLPEKWDPVWFARFCKEVLSLADTRNAIEGSGITITGQPGEVATVSTSSDLTNLLTTTFVTVTPSGVSTERVLAGESGVVTLVDGGANSSITVTLAVHGVPLNKLTLQPTGVLGNKFATSSEVALITPSATLQSMCYDGTTIDFRALDSTYVSDFVEAAQDAVGASLIASPSIIFTYTDGANTIAAAIDPSAALTWTGKQTFSLPIKLAGYTVATLPAGTIGDRAYVTDATAPTYNGALVGGGAVKVPVFFNGVSWVSA